MTKDLEELKDIYLNSIKEIIEEDLTGLQAITDSIIAKDNTITDKRNAFIKKVSTKLMGKGITPEDLDLLMKNPDSWMSDVTAIIMSNLPILAKENDNGKKN